MKKILIILMLFLSFNLVAQDFYNNYKGIENCDFYTAKEIEEMGVNPYDTDMIYNNLDEQRWQKIEKSLIEKYGDYKEYTNRPDRFGDCYLIYFISKGGYIYKMAKRPDWKTPIIGTLRYGYQGWITLTINGKKVTKYVNFGEDWRK